MLSAAGVLVEEGSRSGPLGLLVVTLDMMVLMHHAIE